MNKTGKLAIAFLLLVGGVLALVTGAARSRRPVTVKPLGTQSIAQTPAADLLKEYTLLEQGGRAFSSADLAGTPHVVNFFFASCPSYCRMQSMEVQKLATEYGPQGIAFLSITCDPDNDTPAALQRYADMFSANTAHWKFLTGDMLLLRRIGAEMYSVPVDKQTHSEHLVVVDKWGTIRGRYRWRNHPDELAELQQLLPKLLSETEPPAPEVPDKIVIDEETGRPIKQSELAARQQPTPSDQQAGAEAKSPSEADETPTETDDPQATPADDS